jgi:cytochrome oxidase assembly protein ShyY1
VIWPLLRTPRWIGFSVVVVVVIVAFGLLSAWQWGRAEERRAEGIALLAAVDQAPVDLMDDLRDAGEWTPVLISGTYVAEAQTLVRKRPLNARNGFWVMTPLRASSGTVWINRGWVAAQSDALASPTVAEPPLGTVTVQGYLRAAPDAVAARNVGLPDGQVSDPDPAVLPDVDALPGTYVQLSSSTPAETGIQPLPLPESDDSRNLSYAVQWLLFALVAMGGWFFFLRREALEEAAAADVESDAVSAAPSR